MEPSVTMAIAVDAVRAPLAIAVEAVRVPLVIAVDAVRAPLAIAVDAVRAPLAMLTRDEAPLALLASTSKGSAAGVDPLDDECGTADSRTPPR